MASEQTVTIKKRIRNNTKFKKKEPQKPSNFAVILHNDNYTPKDFVVYVLQEIFNRPVEEAERIMLLVHNKGLGIAGVYHLELAEQKAFDTAIEAKDNDYPLKITIEEIT
jgi:ATP-dependent Clp protease adaptor protein ClpS